MKTDVSENDNGFVNSEVANEHSSINKPFECTRFITSAIDQGASTRERKLNIIFESISNAEKLQEHASYMLINSGMWSDLLCNLKCDVCCNKSTKCDTQRSIWICF